MKLSRINILLVLSLVTSSCGGGSGGTTPANTNSGTAPTPAPVASTVEITGKAIDGYISGAKVYVDMNWSLSLETGEPVTTTDKDGNWKFTEADLKDFPCFKNTGDGRPIIVDVAAGAVDADRGVVKSPFKLLHLPASWLGVSTASNIANVSPFTTLFASAINDAFASLPASQATESIPVNKSCGNQPSSTSILAADPFSTTAGSPAVTVNATTRPAVGSFVVFAGTEQVGGLKISGEYEVKASSSNSFQIISRTPATSTAVGGGKTVSTAYFPTGGNDAYAARTIENQVKKSVEDLAKKFSDAGINFSSFYNDYIATKDSAARSKGEFITDYLARAQDVSDKVVSSVQQDVGASGQLRSKHSISFDVIKEIMTSSPKAVPFDIGIQALGLKLPNGDPATLIFDAKGIRIRSDGFLIPSSCTNSDPFGCVQVPITNADQAIKAASSVYRAILLGSSGNNRSLTFGKTKKGSGYNCENRFLYSYEPALGTVTSTVVSQLEFVYKMEIKSKDEKYDCATGDEGVTFTKKLSYPARANGYFYSLFRYFGSKDSPIVTTNLPYLTDYISKNIIQTTFDPTRANQELNALPSKPTELDAIAVKLPGIWYLQTGSLQEDANLAQNRNNAAIYSCTVKKYNSNDLLREVQGTKDQAIAMCYPDLSVF